MKFKINFILLILALITSTLIHGQPNWTAIKSHASFIVPDTNYLTPQIQPLNIGGWEDGLYISRDGLHIYSTYMPIDVFSWLGDFVQCLNFRPYYRPPLLGIDTLTNPFNCPNYIHSDIVFASRKDTSVPFNAWAKSKLASPATFEGGAAGALLTKDSFDVFVYTTDMGDSLRMEIMFLRNVSINPNTSTAVPIVSSTAQEDNPHIERLNDSTLLLFFDRDRSIHYALSYDNGINWQNPIKITSVLNDQAPYDVQPHLWNDGTDWWVYFCADNSNNQRCIYKSKQLIVNDLDSWGKKELVIAPGSISDSSGQLFGIGEPSLTTWGDLSFVVIYGDINSADSTDVFDCDPWILPRKKTVSSINSFSTKHKTSFTLFPNPAQNFLNIKTQDRHTTVQIFNTMGRLIKEVSFKNSIQLNIKELPKGLYFVSLKNCSTKAMKFIKR